MNLDTKNIVSMSEANRNFSKVTRAVDESGMVVIFKNNTPKYALVAFDELKEDDNTVEKAARKILNKHKKAFEELAK
jgi:antitoxin Phd